MIADLWTATTALLAAPFVVLLIVLAVGSVATGWLVDRPKHQETTPNRNGADL